MSTTHDIFSRSGLKNGPNVEPYSDDILHPKHLWVRNMDNLPCTCCLLDWQIGTMQGTKSLKCVHQLNGKLKLKPYFSKGVT